MDPRLTFLFGLLLLVLFGWYFATDSGRRKRVLGSVLTVLLVAFCVASVYPPLDVKDAKGTVIKHGKIHLGLDLQGGTSFLLRLVREGGGAIDKGMLDQAIGVIDKRVNQFGVSEPVIAPQGEDRILVQIPGLDAAKIAEARQQLQKVAKLELKLVHPQSAQLIPMMEAGTLPAEAYAETAAYDIKTYKETGTDGKQVEEKLLVKKQASVSGDHVAAAHAYFDRGWGISFTLDSTGAEQFAKITQDHTHEQMAIVLDGEVQSAPRINEPIYGGSAQITGHFSEQEARNLASVLQNPLQTPVKIEEERSASSTLGTDAIRSGIYAGIGGLLLVLVFVMIYYRFAGLVAIVGLLVNIILLFGVMSMFNFVLTLPGIAGVILTIGLAVDANVLIYERLREEMSSGKSLGVAIESAYEKAFSVIFDANATTLITAAILFWKATGPVKGFAVTLMVGVVASVFSAMVVTRTIFGWALEAGWLTRIYMLHLISPEKQYDFLGKRRLWISISLAVIAISIIGFVVRYQRNEALGIDFKGGDLLMLEAKEPPAEADLRTALKSADIPEDLIQKVLAMPRNAADFHVRADLLKSGVDEATIRKILTARASALKAKSVSEHEVRSALDMANTVIMKEREPAVNKEFITIRSPVDTADKIEQRLEQTMPQALFVENRKDKVGTVVGRELASTSLWALTLAAIGILFYVTLRFEFSFAIGAIVALLHDVIITVGVFAIAGRELSLIMVGAILTIAGYSINDTIVVYDRIREGLRSGRKGSIQDVMNASINETLSRTLLTSGCTFLSVASLFLFGGPVLRDFAFAILIGIIVGTYSSIFIASPIVLWWSGHKGASLRAEVRRSQEATA